jgi:hypothetical protein
MGAHGNESRPMSRAETAVFALLKTYFQNAFRIWVSGLMR